MLSHWVCLNERIEEKERTVLDGLIALAQSKSRALCPTNPIGLFTD
jgi:hypothetical protein